MITEFLCAEENGFNDTFLVCILKTDMLMAAENQEETLK